MLCGDDMTDDFINPERFQEIWKDILELLDKIQFAAEKGIANHSAIFNDLPEHEKIERELMKNIFQFLQKKWVIEIVNVLAFHEHLYFNEVKNHLETITSKTLSERLKELVDNKIANRQVESSSAPVRVRYSLTTYGKGLHHTLLPFAIYFFTNSQKLGNKSKRG